MTNKFTPKHESMPIENIVPGYWYSFSINPIDEYQYWRSLAVDRREEMFRNYWKNFFLHQNNSYHTRLFPELSPLGRLHFHGLISFETKEHIKRFYMNDIYTLKLKCTFEIDEIEDLEIWMQYITKQQDHFDWAVDNNTAKSKLEKNVPVRITGKKQSQVIDIRDDQGLSKDNFYQDSDYDSDEISEESDLSYSEEISTFT